MIKNIINLPQYEVVRGTLREVFPELKTFEEKVIAADINPHNYIIEDSYLFGWDTESYSYKYLYVDGRLYEVSNYLDGDFSYDEPDCLINHNIDGSIVFECSISLMGQLELFDVLKGKLECAEK